MSEYKSINEKQVEEITLLIGKVIDGHVMSEYIDGCVSTARKLERDMVL